MPLVSALIVTILLNLNVAALPANAPDREGPSWAGRQEVLTRCASPAGFHGRHDRLSAMADDADGPRGIPAPEQGQGMLVLVNGQEGLDIVHTNGQDTLWRASRSESDLLDSGLDEGPYHLVLNAASGPEHFLFAVAADGKGELVWTTAAGMAVTECLAG